MGEISKIVHWGRENEFQKKEKERLAALEASIKSYETANKRLDELLANRTLKLEDFLHYYEGSPQQQEYVRSAISKVSELSYKYDSQVVTEDRLAKVRSDFLEKLIAYQSCEGRWFESDISSIIPTKWDDYINAVDVVLRREIDRNNKSYLALNIDAFSGMSNALKDKMKRNQERLRAGQYGKLDFFHDDSFTGQKNHLPTMVISVSPDTIAELHAAFLNGDTEALDHHPVRRLVVNQMITQLIAGARTLMERPGHTAEATAFLDSARALRSSRGHQDEQNKELSSSYKKRGFNPADVRQTGKIGEFMSEDAQKGRRLTSRQAKEKIAAILRSEDREVQDEKLLAPENLGSVIAMLQTECLKPENLGRVNKREDKIYFPYKRVSTDLVTGERISYQATEVDIVKDGKQGFLRWDFRVTVRHLDGNIKEYANIKSLADFESRIQADIHITRRRMKRMAKA